MKRWIRPLLVVLVVVIVAVALRYTLLRREPVPVTVFRVARGTVEDTVTNSKAGTVKTRRRATLSPEVGGRIVELPVREGDRVEAGQLLLRLADDDREAEVALRRSSLAAAEAAVPEACLKARQAEREYERYLALEGDEIVSRELLDQFESARDVAAAACEAARARVGEARAALQAARVELEKTRLVAPFDAVVAEVSTEVGEWITPSPPGVPIPAVIELLEPEAIYVSAPLDEVDLSRVRVGLPVRITLDVYADSKFQGRLSRVAPYVLDLEEHSRTFEIEVEFAPEYAEIANSLPPGASADVEVILESKEDVLRIPSYAIIEGERVLVVDGERLVAREVQTGLRNWQFAEVVSGLEPGELVVVSLDRAEVQEGARVRIEEETTR